MRYVICAIEGIILCLLLITSVPMQLAVTEYQPFVPVIAPPDTSLKVDPAPAVDSSDTQDKSSKSGNEATSSGKDFFPDKDVDTQPSASTSEPHGEDGVTEPVPSGADSSGDTSQEPQEGDTQNGDSSGYDFSNSDYDFSQPAPEGGAVENDYFADAAFVGDSRTDGLLIYSGVGKVANLTSNGLSIFQLEEKKALKIEGVKYTLIEALALTEYKKVYLSLGVNELGINNDKGFYEAYCSAIDAIRAVQPNAVIYIQGLIPLNEDVIEATGGRDYLKNDHLLIYNDLMRQAAEEKQVVFLDLNTHFAQEDGQLPQEASRDGVHLRKEYCVKWLDYLKNHTVDFGPLSSEVAPDEVPEETMEEQESEA